MDASENEINSVKLDRPEIKENAPFVERIVKIAEKGKTFPFHKATPRGRGDYDDVLLRNAKAGYQGSPCGIKGVLAILLLRNANAG